MVNTWNNGETGIEYTSYYSGDREIVEGIDAYFSPVTGKQLTGEDLEKHKAEFIVPDSFDLQMILDNEASEE